MKRYQILVLLVVYFLKATQQVPYYQLNLALNKFTYSSTSVASQISSYAVNGYYTFLTGASANNNQFCSLTGSIASPNYWGVNLGSSYQIRTIFFSANEDTSTQAWNIGLQFRIGNNSISLSSNPICFTTTYAFSQWIKIKPSGTCTGFGQYIVVTASAPNYYPIRIIELKAYSQVMINNSYYDYKYSSIAVGSAPENIAKTELLVQTGTETSSFTSQQQANPWLQFKIPEYSDVPGFVVISERGQTSLTYQQYINNDLLVTWEENYFYSIYSYVWLLQRTYLNDNNPESTPDSTGYYASYYWQYYSEWLSQITLQRSCSSCKLGVVSVAVLSNCRCQKSQGSVNWQYGAWVKKMQAIRLQVEVGEDPVTLNLNKNEVNDTISMACGDDGYSFCGQRKIKVFDANYGFWIDLTKSNSISVDETAGTITFKTKDMRDVGTRYYYPVFMLKDYLSDWGDDIWIQYFLLTVQVVPSQRMIVDTLGYEVQLINKEDEKSYTNLQYQIVVDDIKDYAFYTKTQTWTQGFQSISSTTVNNLSPDCYDPTQRCFWSLTNQFNPSTDRDKNGNYTVFVKWDIMRNRYFYVYQFGGVWQVHSVTLTLPESLPTYLHDKNNFNMYQDTNWFNGCYLDKTKTICIVLLNATDAIRMNVKEYRSSFKVQMNGFLRYGSYYSTTTFQKQILFLIQRCQINSVTPVKTNFEFSYKIGTPTQRFYLSSYKQNPDCGYKITGATAISVSEFEVFNNLAITDDIKLGDVVYMTVYDTDLSLGGKVVIYQIEVQFDLTTQTNKDVFVTINLLKGTEKLKPPVKVVKPPKIIPPSPKIEEVSDRGVVTVSWSQDMIPISDLNALLDSKPPALSLTLEPGSVETDLSQVQLKSIEFLSYDKREMKIKFLPKDPDQLSLNPIPDVVRVNFYVYDDQINNRLLGFGESITFQDFERRRELLTQFANMTGTAIDSNISITASIPLQFGEKKVRGQMNAFGTSVMAKVMYYIVFGFLSEMIELIVSLSMILHTLMISLSYPANLNTFCDFLYPIVTFDVVQSEMLHQYFFKFNSLNNTSPLSYQFGQIGYGTTLSIWNLGDIFYLVIIFPVVVVIMMIISFLLKLCPSSHKCYKRTIRFLDKQIKRFMWNRCIRFIHTSFIVITIVTLIQLKDLRLSSKYQWQERTSSYFVFVLLVPTILFPLLIFTLYWKKMDRVKPLPEYDARMDPEQLQYLYGTKNVDKIKKLAYTQKKHKYFLETYGTLLKGQNLERNGKMLSIYVPCQEMIRFLVISFILVQFIKYPSMQISVFVYLQLYFISFEVLVKPLDDPIEQLRNTSNEICYMLLNYLMMGMTDYSTYNAKTNYGIGVMILTGITTFSNFYAYFVPKIQRAIQNYKRKKLRKIRNRKLRRLEEAKARVAPNYAKKVQITPEQLAKIKRFGAAQHSRKKFLVNVQNPIQEVSDEESKVQIDQQVTDNAMLSTQLIVRSNLQIKSPSQSNDPAEFSLQLDDNMNQSFAPHKNESQLIEESFDANAAEKQLTDFYIRGGQVKRAEQNNPKGRNALRKQMQQTHGRKLNLVDSFDLYEIELQELQRKERDNVDNFDQLESILDRSISVPPTKNNQIYQIQSRNMRNNQDKQQQEKKYNDSFDQQEKKYNDSLDNI